MILALMLGYKKIYFLLIVLYLPKGLSQNISISEKVKTIANKSIESKSTPTLPANPLL